MPVVERFGGWVAAVRIEAIAARSEIAASKPASVGTPEDPHRTAWPVRAPHPARRPVGRPGYTLVEMFLTVAVLSMVLGFAVNLAQRLRTDSLRRQTDRQFGQLSAALDRYQAEHDGRLPDVPPVIDPTVAGPPREDAIAAAARSNAEAVRRSLGLPPAHGPAGDVLVDPWGCPIVFMPHQSPQIGMAPRDQPFFVSGGPDRRLTTLADNLYSYDLPDDAPAPR